MRNYARNGSLREIVISDFRLVLLTIGITIQHKILNALYFIQSIKNQNTVRLHIKEIRINNYHALRGSMG